MAQGKIRKAFEIQTEGWIPNYKEEWLKQKLDWEDVINKKEIKQYIKDHKWKFPKGKTHFITDLHADADAWFKSLIGAGIIEKTGPLDADFKLTKEGKAGLIIIGGDCLDKGPSNLRLLDGISLVRKAGAKIKILAGNHDVRTYVGLAIGESRKVVAEHMFIRMGRKTIPLFKEIYFKYLDGKLNEGALLSAEEVERRLFPSETWFETYSQEMEGRIPPKKLARETNRIQEKIEEVRKYLKRTGFTHGMLYATVEKAREIFLSKKGEYAWFFDEMEIAYQAGSFLFLHAGLDDFTVDWLEEGGTKALNKRFKKLKATDPFELYHGHIGNVFRTKYRDTDFPLTNKKAGRLRKKTGVSAIIHGHCNTVVGHRMLLKRGVLNFECDTSLDRKTRKIEGLKGVGASWLTLDKNQIVAYSNDKPVVQTLKL